MSECVLVTGASGFIGARVVHKLAERGRRVRGLVRAASRTERCDGVPWEPVLGDLLDRDSMIRAANGCDAIIHLAGVSAWADLDSPRVRPLVVDGTRHVLDAARENRVRRVVFASSAAALGPTRSRAVRDETAPFDERAAARMPYVLAKREAERLCLESRGDAEVVIVNPAEVYGPGDRDLITAGNLVLLLKSSPALVCAGGACVVHVDDVAEAIVRAIDRGRSGERYLLGGDNLAHGEFVRLLFELDGRRVRTVRIPAFLLRSSAAVARRLGLPFPVPFAVIPYATSYWFLDSQKARHDLGVTFRSARETLAETLDWLRDEGHLPRRGDPRSTAL